MISRAPGRSTWAAPGELCRRERRREPRVFNAHEPSSDATADNHGDRARQDRVRGHAALGPGLNGQIRGQRTRVIARVEEGLCAVVKSVGMFVYVYFGPSGCDDMVYRLFTSSEWRGSVLERIQHGRFPNPNIVCVFRKRH